MALRVRFQYQSGASLGFSIERLADGLFYDFADGTFKAGPTTLVTALSADTGSYMGRYRATLTSTPATQFTNGEYCVTIHDMSASNAVVAEMSVVMFNGDDGPVFPTASSGSSGSSGGVSVDPWSIVLPGSYAPGTAGALLASRLDVPVSSRLSSTAYTAPTAPLTAAQVAAAVWDEPRSAHANAGSFGVVLDAAISSRLAATAYVAPAAPLTASQIASAVWDEPGSGHTVAGSFGGRLDAAISSRLPTTSYMVPFPSPTAAQIASAVWTDTNAADFAVLNSAGAKLGAAATSGDPWAKPLPGNYAAGTAGAILGGNLDVPVSTRSTFNGGAVASVTAPVTVGTNNDKGGYALSASGLDVVTVEPGVNARQALSPILAAAAGAINGAGTGTITIKGANTAATRIVATTDLAGNRSVVTLSLPA